MKTNPGPAGRSRLNRLAHEQSPYLLQHAANPVDWHPWSAEALARARAEDKPIFLSVGYSSCHWCHVMAHDSFEHDDVAAALNPWFVPVKVDREERPDLDELYMLATQLMTGRGGWPNSVWLTPDGRPWFAGTFIPREDRAGQPGFKTVLAALHEAWTTRRDAVEEQANRVTAALREAAASASQPSGPPEPEALRRQLDAAVAQFEGTYDRRHGGFGGAPKFPPHGALAFLLAEHARTAAPRLLAMVTGTLDAMLLGGIRDHLGGGFHRYSTDERWFTPHFEKMLYDNAQLARLLAEAFAVSRHPAYAAASRETIHAVLRDLTGDDGLFHAALDADSEGEEGRFYLWSRDDILATLGAPDGERFCSAYHITAAGNYRDEATGRSTGLNIPFLDAATAGEEDALRPAKSLLFAARARRVPPGRDDKVILGWNGLMIGALATAGRLLDEPSFVDAALRAATSLRAAMFRDGRWLHTCRNGVAKTDAFLDDLAALGHAWLDLHEATGDSAWHDDAQRIADDILARFSDVESGAFFSTSPQHEALLLRQKDVFDQAAPSGNSLAVHLLLRLGREASGERFRAAAVRALGALQHAMNVSPAGTAGLLRAASVYLAGCS